MLDRERNARAIAELGDLCLGYLAEHPDELMRFMDATGYDPQRLRGAVGGTALNRGLIDYFAANEPLLLALCSNTGTGVEDFMAVWHRLTGRFS